jgi:hypothetical protein
MRPIDSDWRLDLRGRIALTCIVMAPYVASVILKCIVYPRQYWYVYYDPELWWYIGGLALAGGGQPFVITHPGGPLYYLTALISIAGGYGPLDFAEFRTVGYLVALPINFAGCLLVVSAFGKHGWLIQYIAGTLIFLTPQVFEYNNVWSAELFFPFIAGVCIAAILAAGGRPWRSAKLPAIAGLVLGIAASHKLNFAVVGLAYAISAAAVAGLNGSVALALRLLAVSALAQLAGFLLGSAGLLVSLPEVFQTSTNVVMRQGQFGDGAYGLKLADIGTNISVYVSGSKAYHLIMLVLAMSAGAAIWRGNHFGGSRTRFLAFASVLVIIATYLLAGKFPETLYRYFMPAAVGLVVLFALWAMVIPEHLQKPGRMALLILVAGLVAKHIMQDFQTHQQRVEQSRSIEAGIESALAKAGCARTESVVVLTWRVPLEAFPLRLYSGWRTVQPYAGFLKEVEARFPNVGHVNHMIGKQLQLPGKVVDWDCMVVSDEVRGKMSAPLEHGELVERVGDFSVVKGRR